MLYYIYKAKATDGKDNGYLHPILQSKERGHSDKAVVNIWDIAHCLFHSKERKKMEYEDYLDEQAEEIISRTEFLPTVSDEEWYEGVANS